MDFYSELLLGTDVFRFGADKTTRGHCESKYGSTNPAILFGYAYTCEHANLLTSETLHRHLAEIDQACN